MNDSFLAVLDAMPDAVLVVGRDGVILAANAQCEAVLGYRPDELVDTSVDMLVPEELRATHAGHRAHFAAEPRVRLMGGNLKLHALHHNGYVIPIEISLAPLLGAAGAPEMVIAALRDITERQELEDELRQSQKMEAIGQLAGGIAHDFNNLLTVISGYTEILGRQLGREVERSKELAEIGKAAARAAQMTRQLLAYSRKQVLEPRALDLNDVVTETQGMLERLIGENIEFSMRLAEDLGSTSADSGQIEQVIMNLVVNARDAMPEGGKLLLETGNVTLADVSANRRPGMAPGDYVLLAVTDSGQGMDAATAARIFEPFYTTKERDVGTGLGLSTVYGIVMQSGGHIEVESEPGLGTSFRLYFPQVADEPEAFSPKPPDERSLIGSETVLLVEDEAAVRGVGRAMLETYGYTVLLAGDGAAGLELAQNHPQPIQLLLTDILMPKMGGIELAERLSTLRPELKVLYTSGYNDGGHTLQMAPGSRYLQKPYAMEELARTLRDLLDPTHPPG